jgi:hypothetical protein|tara:strand:+ start:180 stop:746 length:567 start_codon:yes stop_codon:yes gene_type:complete
MKKASYELYALLWLTRKNQEEITQVLTNICRIPKDCVERGMHMTIYYSRRPLPGLSLGRRYESIKANTSETRFMVLAPGGENPRANLIPEHRSVAIRLTKRNIAMPKILELRRGIYKYENEHVLKNRRQKTSDWKNAFGSSHFQAHIKLIRPGSGIDRNLTKIGEVFRKNINDLIFEKFEIRRFLKKW